MEYYTGILVLTTNRVSSLDSAFESRIDIFLNYNELTSSGRARVLTNFLDTLPSEDVDVSAEDVALLVKNPLNGRQIKSAVKTALILAHSEGVKLQKSHLEIVLDIREKGKALMGRSK